MTRLDRTALYAALLLVAVALDGCAPGLADTYASMAVQERTLLGAAQALRTSSAQLDKKCTDDAEDRQHADWCRQRLAQKVDAAVKTLTGAQASTVTARDMLGPFVAAGKAPKEVMRWVGIAIKLYTDVTAALGELGVDVGGLP